MPVVNSSEQLAGEIFVRSAFHIPHAIQPHQHRRIASDFQRERLEIVQPQSLEQLYLDEHQPARLHFGGGGSEVIVPEQGKALLNRLLRDEHAVEPPCADRLRLQVVHVPLQQAQHRFVVDGVVIGAFQQPVYRALDAQRMSGSISLSRALKPVRRRRCANRSLRLDCIVSSRMVLTIIGSGVFSL